MACTCSLSQGLKEWGKFVEISSSNPNENKNISLFNNVQTILEIGCQKDQYVSKMVTSIEKKQQFHSDYENAFP